MGNNSSAMGGRSMNTHIPGGSRPETSTDGGDPRSTFVLVTFYLVSSCFFAHLLPLATCPPRLCPNLVSYLLLTIISPGSALLYFCVASFRWCLPAALTVLHFAIGRAWNELQILRERPCLRPTTIDSSYDELLEKRGGWSLKFEVWCLMYAQCSTCGV